MTLAGAIAPARPAAWVVDGKGTLHLVDFASGQSAAADGVLRDDLLSFISGEGDGRLLAALGEAHPAARIAQALRGLTHLPLTRANAVRLRSFDTLFVEVTSRCNERCRHCYASAGPDTGADLPRAHLESSLTDARALGFRRVQLTGGEPLLRADLPDLVALARALGFEVCEIFTNGTLLDDALLSRLTPLSPSFAFSVYSARAATHDGITRLAGSHAATSAAIRRVLAHGLSARGAVVVMEENARELAETLRFMESLGLDRDACSVAPSHAVGRGRRFEGAYEVPATPGPEREGACDSFERGGTGVLRIAADGGVFPCIFNRVDRLGSLADRTLAEILRDPGRAAAPPVPPAEFMRLASSRLQCLTCRATAWVLQLAEPP
ncbi:MAG TPA: radical SAM protein [Myxococcales bacterium]|jgi:organic radical activating enzyme